MENKKDFITKDAEIKYLRSRIEYLELENENLRLKLKFAESQNWPPEKNKNEEETIEYVYMDPFYGPMTVKKRKIPTITEYELSRSWINSSKN